MRAAGIIAEYNPFHNGHAFQIEETRKLLSKDDSDTAIVAVMSGNYVQRGDFSIMNKYARAKCALKREAKDGDGADLIIELPLPYSCASAEFFASGAVRLLDCLGVIDVLSFGSEHGKVDGLSNIARCLLSAEANKRITERLKSGASYASARQAAVAEFLPEQAVFMREPNNILGIEYIKALLLTQSKIEPVTVKRKISRHDGHGAVSGFASASYIRALMHEGNDDAYLYMPGRCEIFIKEEFSAKRAPVSVKYCERALLAHFRKMDAAHFNGLPDATEGLSNRIMKTAKAAVGIDEIIEKAGTKRYPDSRIRRMLLFSYLGITPEMQCFSPGYVRVLAANETGLRLLKIMKKTCGIPVITKPAHAKKLDGGARAMFELSAAATDLFALAYPGLDGAASGGEWTGNAEIYERRSYDDRK